MFFRESDAVITFQLKAIQKSHIYHICIMNLDERTFLIHFPYKKGINSKQICNR